MPNNFSIEIFDQEKADGLEHILSSSASISYANLASPCSIINKTSLKNKIKSVASYNDEDLYYSQAILVTSSWNKNDDIFDKYEVWAAKKTPEHKPTNLEHNEDIIVGHIISNWPITDEGQVISEETSPESLPDKFHILTGSVIYRGFTIPELKERADKLIAEINGGKKYVSMECFFKGFDYGIMDKVTGKYKILARNNETAHLTKYLRAYGGAGEHENYKIGRVLRNITFSGKGYVDRPANEDSVIFSGNVVPENNNENLEEKNKEIAQMGVSNFQSITNSETNTMPKAQSSEVVDTVTTPEPEVTTDVVNDTASAELLALQQANEKLVADIAELSKSKDAEIEALKEEAAKKDAEMKKKDEEMMKKVKSSEEEIEKIKTDLASALEAIAGYKMKEEDNMKKDKAMKRKASLVEQGVDEETAASIIEKFESMDDESFAAMSSMFTSFAAKTKKDDKKVEDKMPSGDSTKCSTSVDADPGLLDTVEATEEVSLSVASVVDSTIDPVSEALASFVRSRLKR